MTQLMVTRFNNNTKNENTRWREKNDFLGCIYNSPVHIKETIPLMITIFVIEMNNDENKILGFGKIKNKVYTDKKYRIYEDRNYNRYTYRGEKRIDIENITNITNIDNIDNKKLKENQDNIKKLEKRLFKGKSHLKRGHGITQLPIDIKNEYLKLITELFLSTT